MSLILAITISPPIAPVAFILTWVFELTILTISAIRINKRYDKKQKLKTEDENDAHFNHDRKLPELQKTEKQTKRD